jgi:hypothetical protein
MGKKLSGKARHYFTATLSLVLLVFLVLFPKGGIKLGTVPLTWGYLLLAITLPFLAAVRILGFPLRMRSRTLVACAVPIPFFIIFVYSFLANGVADVGAMLSDLTSFFVLPFAFLFVYPAFLKRMDGERFSAQFRFCILAAAIFGIFLFVWYPITKHLIEVPYLTVNAADYGEIAETKNISRGAFLKLISTYNNGNLYGAAMLIVLPMYDKLEKRGWRRLVLKLALVLTLSRTVWIGLVAEQMLSLLRLGLDAARNFPRIRATSVLKRIFLLVVTAVAILGGLLLITSKLSFLFDSQLGGRASGLTASLDATWLPSQPITYFSEIVYSSAALNFGIVGFLAIALLFASPAILAFTDSTIVESPMRGAALKGLMVYAVIAAGDGAVNLIPVMALYWFTYMVYLEGWPGTPSVGEPFPLPSDMLRTTVTDAPAI